MAEFTFEIVEELGAIGQPTEKGWQTLVTRTSFGGRKAKLDIRSWNEDRTRMGKGISFTNAEVEDLLAILQGVSVSSEDDLRETLESGYGM